MADQIATPVSEIAAEAAQSSENQTPEAQEAGSAPEAAATPVEAIKQEIKRLKSLKIKVDGKEFDEELPFEFDDNPETVEYLRKNLQLSKVSQKRMSEKATLENEVKRFVEQLRKDPESVLSDPALGLDLKKLAAKIIEKEIEDSKKSPEQLEKEKLQTRLKQLEDEREKEKEEYKTREIARLQEQEYERYDMLMTKALEKTDLPKSPYIVKKIADYMLMGLKDGIDITPEDVLPLVRDEMQNDLKEMFAVMPDEVVESIVGKDVFNRIRKKNLAKAKNQPTTSLKGAIKDIGVTKQSAEVPAGAKKTFKDYFGV